MIEERFRAGDLAGALEAATAQVKAKPTELDARHSLLLLLLFAGEVERAEKQLHALARLDGEAHTGPAVYQALLASEWERRQVFAGRERASLPPGAPEWAAERAEALQRLSQGDEAGATACIERADEAVTPTSGKADGRAFAAFCDSDDVLGEQIEIFAGGRYLWMPVCRLRSLRLMPVETALDTLYRPAHIEDVDGEGADVYLPVLYADSHRAERDSIRLGRETIWVERGDLALGAGQHVYWLGEGDDQTEVGLLELSLLEFDSAG